MDKLKIETELNVMESYTAGIINMITSLNNSVENIRLELNGGIIIEPGILKAPELLARMTGEAGKPYGFIFNAPILMDGNLIAFVNNGGTISKVVYSLIGSVVSKDVCNAPYGSIIYVDGKYYASYHKWHVMRQSYCTTYYSASQGGILWSDTAIDRIDLTGEDRTFKKYGNKFIQYIRPNPPQVSDRSIGVQSSEHYNGGYTPVSQILTPPGPHKQYYMMSVIQTSAGFFGLLTTYKPEQGGLTEIQLTYSQDGLTNWKHCNNEKPFIVKPSGLKQMYGNWSIVNNKAVIFTIENFEGHDETTFDKFFSNTYSIDIAELIKYKPL